MNDRQLFRTFFLFGLFLFAPCFVATCIAEDEVDTDGDGLSDFHETHKYLTDPNKADSDGDGTADGDWLERREYQYTVRSVAHVMKPVTPEYLKRRLPGCSNTGRNRHLCRVRGHSLSNEYCGFDHKGRQKLAPEYQEA